MKNIKILSNMDIFNKFGRKNNIPIMSIDKEITGNLKTNIVTSTTYHSYSMCIEYMKNWFYSKFPTNFFKNKYLEASHILSYLEQGIKVRDMVEPAMPAAAIVADLDMSFNRENIDLHNFGLNFYNNRCSYLDSFFYDKDKLLFLACTMEMLLLRFTFKIQVAYRGIQMDVAKLCQMAFRSNGTQKHFNDLEYLVPPELMEQLAEDAGYELDRNNIYSINTFLNYLNSHSRLPFFYKLNMSTGNMDWYMKMSNVIVHIRTEDINADSGNRRNMKDTNFQVSFDCQVRFPSPKFYAYYTMVEKESLKKIRKLDAKSFAISVEEINKIPSKDEHGWNWNVKTEFMFNSDEEIEKIKQGGKGLSIHFEELIGNLRDVIDYTKSIAISPDIFLNIKVFNFDKIVKSHIDWNKYEIVFDEPIESCKCVLIIYMDSLYFNETITKMRHYEKNRIQPAHVKKSPEDIDIDTYTYSHKVL